MITMRGDDESLQPVAGAANLEIKVPDAADDPGFVVLQVVVFWLLLLYFRKHGGK